MSGDSEFLEARKRLWNEIVMVHDSWAQYQELYKHSEARIELLNGCARWFFGSHQRILLREVILAISRLTDRPSTGRHENLTLDLLLTDPVLPSHPEVRPDLDAAIDEAKAASLDIRCHRDKYIAHLDYNTAVRVEENPLPRLPVTAIPTALAAIERAYNLHGTRVRDVHSIFDLEPMGSVANLLSILESSERWRLVQEYRADHHDDPT